jgi:hypothetical protein
MPYYVVPQVTVEVKDELGVVVDTYVKPDLPGGVSWRGDTNGVNYLVFVDRELPPGGRYTLVRGNMIHAAIAANPHVTREIADRWRLGKEQPIPEPAPGPAPIGGP